MSAPDPRASYRRRLETRQLELDRWSKRELWVSWSRLVAIVVGLVLAWLSIQSRLLSPIWALLPFVAFALLVVVHERVLRKKARAQRAVEYCQRGLARLDHEWMGHGDDGERFRDPEHLYADDLDLFGRGSLFELLDTTRTRAGAETLAVWLKAPAAPDEIGSRQEAVADLAPRLELREELWTIGEDLGPANRQDQGRGDSRGRWQSGLDPNQLIDWAGAESRLSRWQWLRFVLPVLTLANLTAAFGWWQLGWGSPPLVALVLGELVLFLFTRRPVAETIAGVDQASSDLLMLSQFFARVAAEDFTAPRLVERAASLSSTATGASAQVARLQRLTDLVESRRNPFFAPFAAFLLWTSQLAFRIDDWRLEHGSEVARWLEIVGELEALTCFATFSFERPALPFAEIVADDSARAGSNQTATESPQIPVFEGRELGHPLLAESVCIRNDIALGPQRQALIVSGSNMSGKSTYLRTCGVNAVLALAGAPVVARSLKLTPLRVGSTIRIQDSLQGGASRFYAEILRLRRLLDQAKGPLPTLFLLDEILHGTNSHDRRLGAEAVLHAFLARGAIGLVTTHDLALAEIAKSPESKMDNVHFEDFIEAGEVRFDYEVKEGVVERSNALALMREVGLEV